MKIRTKKSLILLIIALTISSAAGRMQIINAEAAEKEFNAVWITYLEFSSNGYTEKAFKSHINIMFDKGVDMGMNAVVVHVRPFSDAFYPSKYYPWSKYVSGEQGKDPGYDPLAYMIDAAHKRGLEFHAWINPYRITSSSTDITTLSKVSPARKYMEDKDKANNRYVLTYDGKLYFNPSYSAVRTLIVNGVKEIVENYDVDGIHFDDYFYPALGSKYESVFDAQEYKEYKNKQIKAGEDYRNIVSWRKWQVNSLVYRVYETIKKANKNIQFGISPEGYIDNLLAKDKHYTDLNTWFTKKGYIDYICPQLYFSFEHPVAAFDKLLDKWTELMGNTKVKLYIGIPVYKAGSKEEIQFKNDAMILKNMVILSRNKEKVSGFVYYRYNNLISSVSNKAVKNLLTVIK